MLHAVDKRISTVLMKFSKTPESLLWFTWKEKVRGEGKKGVGGRNDHFYNFSKA
jgi:hypothetical protein